MSDKPTSIFNNSITYKIMHNTEVIALCDDSSVVEILNKSLCPHCFNVGMNLSHWMYARMIDTHRSNSRKLFKALRLSSGNEDIANIISIGHGMTITDDWWIQGIDEELDFYSLREYNEAIADISLNGIMSSQPSNFGYTQLGTTGSFEKCWRYCDNKLVMYKQGKLPELVSEYFSYLFLKALGVNVADYNIVKHLDVLGNKDYTIRTNDFTNQEYDFEPFYNLFYDNEDIEYIIARLDERLRKSYIEMIYYDALLFNADRHNENVGILRDKITGDTIALAPYFDYNLSLVANGVPTFVSNSGNLLINEFKADKDCMSELGGFKPARNSVLTAIDFANQEVLSTFGNIDTSVICNYIINAYDLI